MDPGTEPDEGNDPLRVIIADDDALARRVLRDALQAAGIIVIAEAPDGREAVELAVHYRPDVVVMDVVMPVLDGLEATRRIVERAADVKVVMLTSTEDVDVGLVGLRAGAVGYLSKSLPPESLPAALAAARNGEAVVSRRMTTALVESVRRLREDGAGLRPVRSPLTPREWEVLDLLCDGLTTDGDRRPPLPLGRDGAVARQEDPAQARGPLARRGGGGRPPAARGPALGRGVREQDRVRSLPRRGGGAGCPWGS